jgi:glycosyltransferase EpsH
MKVSIITPVYNAEKHIRKTIDSVMQQAYHDYEWILIDDGSTDTSGRIIDDAASNDERILVVHQENQGVSAARNKGLDICRGKYVVFLDADDFLLEDSISNRLDKIRKCDCLFTDYIELNAGFNPYRVLRDRICKSEVAIKYLFAPGKLGYQGYLSNKMFVSDIIRRNNIRFDANISYNEDRLFVFRYLRHCKNVAISSDKTYAYVHNEESKMGRVLAGKFEKEMLTELDAFDIMKQQLKVDNSKTYYYCCKEMRDAALRLSDMTPNDISVLRMLNEIEYSNFKEIIHAKGMYRLKFKVIKDRMLRISLKKSGNKNDL